jgi:DNA repair protein RecO (recombination protein O)
MTAIQMQCSFRETKDIHYIKEAHLYRDPGMEIYMDPIKGSLTFFMAELVKNGLFPSYENKELFEFCENSILELQEADAHQTALFPLYFTLMLCSYLGIAIHLNEQSEYFDLVHAHATARKPEHKEYLCRQELELLRALLGTKFDDLTELKTIKSVRLKLLRSLLKYIHFQMEHFKDLKSLNVLEQIFNN